MKRRFFSNKTSEKIDLSKPYFAVEALEDNLLVKLSINACEYCIDDGTWITLPTNTSTVYINAGQTLSFRGNLMPDSSNGIGTFNISKKCNIKGNVMSLLYGDDFEEQNDLTNKNYAFYQLFINCNKIIDASELILPATTLASKCYAYMFYGCTNLKNAPQLPATTLANLCYYKMFSGCTSLVTAPELPATTLTNSCYAYMFESCTSLVTAPALPATTLAKDCYGYMFYNCTSLVTAPELPATTLVRQCYQSMFEGCTSLNYIKALFTTTPGLDYTSNWVFRVSSTGTFIKNKNATWNVTDTDGIPTRWTVQTV